MRRRHRLHFVASRVHKWLALLIGAQLLVWFASGLVMSLLPIERVRGEHLVDTRPAGTLNTGADFGQPGSILAKVDEPIRSLTFRPLLGRPVAEVELADGSRSLRDAASGAPLIVGAPLAESIARSAYHGEGRPSSVTRVHEASTEYRGSLPAWQVVFDDPSDTRIYIAGDTGRISAVRTGTWRVYDFLWGLHIMDWKNHEDFNTPWLSGFAAGGLVLFFAGLILLIMRWPLRRRKRRTASQGKQ